MSTHLGPVVGNWYLRLDKEQTFMVVDLDETEGTIAIQREDGEFDEMSIDAWNDMELEATDEPEDWSDLSDDFDEDDLDYDESEEDEDWSDDEDMPARGKGRSEDSEADEDWED